MKKTSCSLSRTPLKRTGGKIKSKPVSSEKRTEIEEQRMSDMAFYSYLWRQVGPYSEVSGTGLGNEVNKACIHHIWPKSKYPSLRYVKDNCILLTIDEHATVEMDIYRYSEVNKRREQLKQKYNL